MLADCGVLNEIISIGSDTPVLGPWLVVCLGGLGGVALLEEVCQWEGQILRFQSHTPLSSLLYFLLVVQDVSSLL